MKEKQTGIWWPSLVAGVVLVLIVLGLGVIQYRRSQVVGHSEYRFNITLISKGEGVTFLSFDPVSQGVLALNFPPEMSINSRSSGEYSIASLYQLGAYQGDGGEFARRKIQGFMRVPVPGYLVVEAKEGSIKRNFKRGLVSAWFGMSETSLSKFDIGWLYLRSNRYSWREVAESELVRAGVIADQTYQPGRLQDYVGSRLFDWGIGAERTTIAVINASGENGLGSDMADFLGNLGYDVVMVRSANTDQELEVSQWQVSDTVVAKEMRYVLSNLFGLNDPHIEKVGEEYRAEVLITVGKDAKELF